MKRVLVVDDSPTVRALVRTTLEAGGYETVEAANGGEGLARLRDDSAIALVISDVNMPVMDGLDFLDELARSSCRKSLPFVLLTSESASALVERARKAGARGWMTKPVRPVLLLAAVRKLLGSA